jgi:PhnB protein
MEKIVNPIPEGLRSVTPGLTVRGAAQAIAFYCKAFAAEELRRFTARDGAIMHAEIRIGDSVVLVNDEIATVGLYSPTHYGGPTSALTIHCPDPDVLYARAKAAGATELSPMQDTFTGERFGILKCPFGHRWIIAARVEEVPTQEIQRRLDKMMSEGAVAPGRSTIAEGESLPRSGEVRFLNPPGIRTNPAFTNVVVTSGSVRTAYIGAIDPVDAKGALVGKDDIGAQTDQIFANLGITLSAAGAKLEDIVLWRIFVVHGHPLGPAFAAFQRAWGARPNPPTNTIVFVPALGFPGSLIALEAIAVVPN